MMTTVTDNAMRVWVGCLACYNDGRLTGDWVDATEAGDYVPCDRAGHEEWWVFDTDGLPGVGECSPDEAQRYAETVAACVEATGAPTGAVFAYLDNLHGGVADTSALDSFEDAYVGEYECDLQFAQHLADDLGMAHDYFDYDAWTRDLFMSDYWSERTPDGCVWVFRNV